MSYLFCIGKCLFHSFKKISIKRFRRSYRDRLSQIIEYQPSFSIRKLFPHSPLPLAPPLFIIWLVLASFKVRRKTPQICNLPVRSFLSPRWTLSSLELPAKYTVLHRSHLPFLQHSQPALEISSNFALFMKLPICS